MNRRTLVNAAWTVPVVAAAIGAPAAAASQPTPPSVLVETHFPVYASHRGFVSVQLGYQGERQGYGQPDIATRVTIEVRASNGVIISETTSDRLLVLSGYSGNIISEHSVPLTGTVLVYYFVRDGSGNILLSGSKAFTAPDWWKW